MTKFFVWDVGKRYKKSALMLNLLPDTALNVLKICQQKKERSLKVGVLETIGNGESVLE